MTAMEPNCSKRHCIHYTSFHESLTPGIVVPTCHAFPDCIPDEIAYGDNHHTEPFAGDNGIRFEFDENWDVPPPGLEEWRKNWRGK